jgi:hypothetical protein
MHALTFPQLHRIKHQGHVTMLTKPPWICLIRRIHLPLCMTTEIEHRRQLTLLLCRAIQVPCYMGTWHALKVNLFHHIVSPFQHSSNRRVQRSALRQWGKPKHLQPLPAPFLQAPRPLLCSHWSRYRGAGHLTRILANATVDRLGPDQRHRMAGRRRPLEESGWLVSWGNNGYLSFKYLSKKPSTSGRRSRCFG